MTRDEAVNTPVTLNGRPARIVGKQNDHATVVALDNGEGYEWSWIGVFRILEGDRNFTP